MGNSASSVTSGIKNQVDGSKNAIYPLADVTGQVVFGQLFDFLFLSNGELALMAKEALRNGSTEELDAAIKEVAFFKKIFLNQFVQKITPFLYNEGKGDLLSIDRIIKIRHKERTGKC